MARSIAGLAVIAALIALSSCTPNQLVGSTATAGGATFKAISAQRSTQAGSLQVTVEVRTTNAITISAGRSSYLATSGEKRQVTEVDGPSELGAASTATLTLTIPGVETGGTLTVGGCTGEGCDNPYTARIKVGGLAATPHPDQETNPCAAPAVC